MIHTDRIFALDIGTQSVVGIILEKDGSIFKVIDILSMEHTERAMLDGQIHDVPAVSRVISDLKTELEKNYGPLKKVCVAAAGRSLKTVAAEAAVGIHGKPIMTRDDILHLELTAVQHAQAVAAEHNNHLHYYCVGYSVLYYRLDGEEIGSLIDQSGKEASVEVIATFLPRVVVESLMSALSRAGLEMEALTLEPIAAINVLIPPSMRRINVALVDIGAGTSDIAITDKGTVIAYGMVPVAGDEITEAISDQFLLDFPLAEKAKRDVHSKDLITITDILGFDAEITKEDLIREISVSLDQLAEAICKEILFLNNQKAPKAVMLVGGGSLTPDLPLRISKKLQLPENRVAVRGIEAISGLTIAEHIQKGPELVTPIGIAVAAKNAPVQYASVYVNGQPVRLFEIQKLTIGDCLLAAGIKMNQLYGKPGLAKMVSLNGKVITIPGKLGDPPSIYKNGKISSLDENVENGDQLLVERGIDGEETPMKIGDLIDHLPSKTIFINGERYKVGQRIICNGVESSAEELLKDRDEVIIEETQTIEKAMKLLQKEELLLDLKPFEVKLNGSRIKVASLSGRILSNGKIVSKEHTFEDLSDIKIFPTGKCTVGELAESQGIILNETIPVFFNGQKVVLTKLAAHFIRNGYILGEEDILFNGDNLLLEKKEPEPFIFQDLFNNVEIQYPEKVEGSYKLLKNGKETAFFDTLAPGDHLEIVWPQSNKY
ncbi:pilus assembly protein PilM [Neobacillus terrae]|uniref:pilus assembly protein PilM n=1 Tax=Neobacillus terrae TaxID=3034837 RepID=UPI001A9C6379|nr:pilus assembly protein PilM [Neobacillus terrae]